MKLFFPIFLIITFIFYLKVKSTSGSDEDQAAVFLERESKANQTRRQNIDNLDYITIPFEKLPFLDNPPKIISRYENDIQNFKDKRILNLNGISNTELKLTYGVANLTRLSEYDENYTNMLNIFNKWSSALLEKGYTYEAMAVLEIAIEIGCDSSNIFLTLNSLYKDKGIDRTDYLIDMANRTNTPMKDSIIKKLKA